MAKCYRQFSARYFTPSLFQGNQAILRVRLGGTAAPGCAPKTWAI